MAKKKTQTWGQGGIVGGGTPYEQMKNDNKFQIIKRGNINTRNIDHYNGQWDTNVKNNADKKL